MLSITALFRRLFIQTPLASAMGRNANNIDLFRLIAACLVIYGHAFAVAPEPGKQDFLAHLAGYPSAGMAVKLFFFLSGLLVTNSLLQKRSASQFLIARFFRIWPALALVLVVCAFVIGPLCTTLDLNSYFTDANTFLYTKRYLFMETWGKQALGYTNLPGVFANNPYPKTVNASLWSLGAEVYAYLFLAATFLVGLLEKRITTILIVLVLLDSILPFRIVFTFLPRGFEDFSYLPFCFASGAFMALHKDRIRVSIGIPLGFFLLFYLLHGTPYARYFFYLLTFTGVLYLATCEWVIRIRLPADVSYGVFLWGFPIQQTLVHVMPNISLVSNQIATILLAIVCGTVSWVLVEKRAIEFGKKLSRGLEAAESGQQPPGLASARSVY